MKSLVLCAALAACTVELPDRDERLVGVWKDANAGLLEVLTFSSSGGVTSTYPGYQTESGKWETEGGFVIFDWESGTQTAEYQISDGGDTLVIEPFGEVLTMMRVK